nr:PREDICTED: kazal-type serine protease inhibitor domain-containing protein 1 [Anolis carolinensis]|eukprot:XP_008114018.1 PREDICTED: kazal-type serine protease inhibitor domain-containing protein 1 [Anolis carolinensis]
MKPLVVIAVLVGALGEVSQTFPAWYHRGWLRLLREGDGCGPCHMEHCPVPTNCRAGTVLDLCGCCPECGNIEGQICDLDQGSNFYGHCGDNLECHLDVDDIKSGEIPEPQCVCKSEEMVCGPDGRTYENICQFREAYAEKGTNSSIKHKGPCKSGKEMWVGERVRVGGSRGAWKRRPGSFFCHCYSRATWETWRTWKRDLEVPSPLPSPQRFPAHPLASLACLPGGAVSSSLAAGSEAARTAWQAPSKGPADAAPVISLSPQDTQNFTGNDVIFGCEVSAYPMPHLEWKKKGNKMFLPGDDAHISIQARGGPQRYSVTGWLQIQGIRKSDEGVYVCETKNKYGFAYSSAKLEVIDDSSSFHDIPRSWMTSDNADYGDSFDSVEEEEEVVEHTSSGDYAK